MARQLAVLLAEAHLAAAHDVVLPQYVGQLAFVEGLAAIADRAGARFVEVVLVAEGATTAARFRSRRTAYLADGVAHPESDLADATLEAEIAEAAERLATVGAARPATLVVRADAGLEATWTALQIALAGLPA